MADTPAPQLDEARLTHVALPCADLDETLEFYTSVTPLVVVARNEDANGRGAWLSNPYQSRDPFVLVLAEFRAATEGDAGSEPRRPVPILTPFAHIGIDTALGYGLKFPTSFQVTHLGRIGKKSVEEP